MRLTIIIIFILLTISYYLVRHFENRRNARNEAHREKRRDAFFDLLKKVKPGNDPDHANTNSKNV
jgi:hypothetical protein